MAFRPTNGSVSRLSVAAWRTHIQFDDAARKDAHGEEMRSSQRCKRSYARGCSGAQIKIAFAEYRRMYRSDFRMKTEVTMPRFSDVKPRSAECRSGRSPADEDQIRLMARAIHRDRGLVLIDLIKIPNDIDRAFVERIAIEQGV